MPRFDVNFTDPKKFFYPGETVAGNIIVRLDSAINCKKVEVKFKGKSYVRWTTGSGDDKKTHWNTEEYFKINFTLAAPAPQENVLPLPPGDFSYPFHFQLPSNLPPTVETRGLATGYVRYYMKIKIDVDSWKLKSDIEEKIPFKVAALPVDLNQTRHLLEPATATEEKFLCCLCCQSGPIRLVGRIQKQAYHLGEQIIFSFGLDNKETNKPLRKIEARLMEQFTYTSNTGRTREVEHVKSSVRLSEGVPAGGEDSWNDNAMNIPTDILPSFNNCKCMRLEYFFTVNVDIQSAFDPKIAFPITISCAPHVVQPIFQPPLVPGSAMPGVVYPPAPGGAMLPPAGPPPSAGYPPSMAYPQPTAHPPTAITQQPGTWNTDVPPPAYIAEEKK